MSRKPADKLRPNETRQAIWEWIRSYKNPALENCFTVNDVALHINLEAGSIRDYLTGLTAANPPFLESTFVESTGRFPMRLYKLVRDNGREAPRVRKDGSIVTMGLAREKMWIAMGIRAQKGLVFTVKDLTIGSTKEVPVSEVDANSYCHALHRMGYLVVVTPGTLGQPTVYRMPRNKWTGAKPVQIQRTKRGFDPNTGAVAHISITSIEGGE